MAASSTHFLSIIAIFIAISNGIRVDSGTLFTNYTNDLIEAGLERCKSKAPVKGGKE